MGSKIDIKTRRLAQSKHFIKTTKEVEADDAKALDRALKKASQAHAS